MAAGEAQDTAMAEASLIAKVHSRGQHQDDEESVMSSLSGESAGEREKGGSAARGDSICSAEQMQDARMDERDGRDGMEGGRGQRTYIMG